MSNNKFEKIRQTQMPEYEGTGSYYVHKETGMEVFHIKNNSSELTCCFAFATPSEDSKGVAHILEHTVLCGSERFPVKDPFVQVLASSPNTFLNAMTFTDKTVYPFASPLKKDFDILFDIYADAVFAPLLRKESFEQEGVRFFGDTFDGVVFNEMSGAESSEEELLTNACMKNLYRGTACQYDSGGDPVYIADLTYEEYLDRYKKWYSPANCRLFLYGDLDVQEYLNKLERYLTAERMKDRNNVKIIPCPDKYYDKDANKTNKSETSDKKMPSAEAVKEKCPIKECSSVVLSWLTAPSDDPLEILTLSVLVDILLGNPGAPLYRAITESGLGEDLHPASGMDADFPLMPFTVGFTGAKKGKEREIEELILSTLGRLAKDGLPEDAVNSALRRQEFKIREIQGDRYPYGILVALRAVRCWLRGTEPESALDSTGLFLELKKRLAEGRYFETWIQKNILENKCFLVSLSYDPDFNASRSRLLEEKNKKRRAEVPADVLENERKKFEVFVSSADSPQALASIGRIRKTDIPENIPSFREDTLTQGKAIIKTVELFTRGIVYCNTAFSTDGLTEEEMKLLPLLLRLMQMCGTKTMDYTQVGNMVRLLTGGFSISHTAASTCKGELCGNVLVRTKMFAEDLEPALELVRSIILEGDFKDTKRIKAALTDLITDFESGFVYSASYYAGLYASAQYTDASRESDITSGISGWLYMKRLKESLGDNFSPLTERLEALRKKLFCQSTMIFQIGCETTALENSLTAVRKSICTYPEGNFVRITDKYGRSTYKGIKSTGSTEKNGRCLDIFTLSSGPAFNSRVFPVNPDPSENISEKELVAYTLLAYALSSGYLWNNGRSRNGAYGVSSQLELQERLFICTSYRDPCISETYRIFEDALKTGVSPEELEYVVVTVTGRELKPLTPGYRCIETLRRDLYGLTDELYLVHRKLMLDMTSADLKGAAEKLTRLLNENGCTDVTVCGSETAESDVLGPQDRNRAQINPLPI